MIVATPGPNERRRGGLLGFGVILSDLRDQLDWREEAQMLAMIGAESAVGYLLLSVLLPEIHPPYEPFPGWLFFGLLLVSYGLPHLLDELRVWGLRYEAIMAVGIVLSLLVALKVAAFPHHHWLDTTWLFGTVDGLIIKENDSVRPPWAIVGLLLYIWWRGRTRAEPILETAYQMLRWGTLAATVGLLLVLIAAPRVSRVHDTMPLAVVLFFVAALAAVGIARFRLEGLRSGSPLGPHWLATFAAPIGGTVLIAVVAAGIFSRHFLVTLLVILGPLFWLLGFILRALILLIALIAFIVIAPILWLLERQGLGNLSFSGRMPRVANPLAQVDQFAHDTLHVADPVRYLIAGLVLVLIGSLLIRYLYRRRRRWRETAEERRESVLAWPDAFGGLPERLRRLVRRPRPRADSLARLRGDPRWVHTIFIRETYQRLLRRGAHAGAPLRAGMTPNEYEGKIAERFPEAGVEIGTITDAYDAARYGADPATPEAADLVRRAWATMIERHERG